MDPVALQQLMEVLQSADSLPSRWLQIIQMVLSTVALGVVVVATWKVSSFVVWVNDHFKAHDDRFKMNELLTKELNEALIRVTQLVHQLDKELALIKARTP